MNIECGHTELWRGIPIVGVASASGASCFASCFLPDAGAGDSACLEQWTHCLDQRCSRTAMILRSGQRRGPSFFYWSTVEKRWKPVRRHRLKAMRSARAIAGEVSSYIESHPPLDSGATKVKGKLAAQDPNYSQAAGNRSVSAAEIDRYINEAAARHHVDPNLVRALVKVESNFNPRAVSRKGAMGLMQLMPETARMYDVRNPFDAAQNVDAGVRHLKGLLENFSGDVSLSLAAYNAGQGAVERNRGIPPYTETRNYVKRITTLMGSSGSDVLPSVAYRSPFRSAAMRAADW